MSNTLINPADGSELKSYENHTKAEVEDILENSHLAYKSWKLKSFPERAKLLNRIADLLEENKAELARMATTEMGKVLRESVAEVEKCATVCRYYAENGESFLKNLSLESDADRSYVRWNPLGPVLAIMPWNFPYWQVFRFSAPALMAGNTVVLKHAPNVPGCARLIQYLFKKAGFPENVFSLVFADNDTANDIISDKRIAAVTLTGSTRAGKAVAETAGRNLKKCVLELGGSDPYLILDDAPLDKTVDACVTSRLINGGQSCVAAKRFIVTEKNYDAFLEKMISGMRSKKHGDPFDDSSDFGPMAREDLRDTLHKQVTKSIEKGAKLHLGGEVPDKPGAWYPSTVLSDVKPGMPAFDEELFGPVAAIIKAKNEDEAIELANQTIYGLGAAVFTSDTKKGEKIAAEKLEAGCCFVNEFVKSDPRLPFGGIRESGFGRELSHFGIREFVNVKTVYVKEG